MNMTNTSVGIDENQIPSGIRNLTAGGGPVGQGGPGVLVGPGGPGGAGGAGGAGGLVGPGGPGGPSGPGGPEERGQGKPTFHGNQKQDSS